MQSLNDEREGALWKEEAETSHQEGMRAGRPKGQCHQSPSRCPPPILTLQGDWWPLGMARDGSRWVCAAPSSIAPHFTYGPGEAEGEADGIAEGGVGAARAVGDAEGVGAEDGGDGAAVGAGRLGGHAGLVVLEAHAEEGLAVALLEPAGAGAAPPAAVAVAEQPLLIDKLLQLQLEDPGGADLRGGDSGPQTPSSPLPSPAPAPPPRSSRLRQAATAPGSPAGTPRCRDPPGSIPVPSPRALTWQRLSSTERTASVSRNRPPILEVQLWCPRFPPPLSSRQREKGKVSLGVKGKNTAAKAARPSGAGRVSVTVSFFQECL